MTRLIFVVHPRERHSIMTKRFDSYQVSNGEIRTTFSQGLRTQMVWLCYNLLPDIYIVPF